MKAGFSDLGINVNQAHIRDNMAWAVRDFTETGPGPNNATKPYGGNWGAVYTRDDAGWKVQMLTYNLIETPPK